MMRVHVETRAPLEVCKQAENASRFLFATALFAAVALVAGCSGLVSQSSSNTPPPQTQTYSVSGTISPSAGGSGATVTLSGAATATATANSSGAYTFTGLANGTYAVTPSRTGYTFSPTTQSATINGANVTGINFSANVQVTPQ
jgi:ABC-type oligopeptide transport system substrate-binding subunit